MEQFRISIMEQFKLDQQMALLNAEYESKKNMIQRQITYAQERISDLNLQIMEEKRNIRNLRSEVDDLRVDFLNKKTTILNDVQIIV